MTISMKAVSAFAFTGLALMMSATAFAAATPEVVQFQAELFTGDCTAQGYEQFCVLPTTVGRPVSIKLVPTSDPRFAQGSSFFYTRASGYDFEAQVVVRKDLSKGSYELQLFHTSPGYDYYGRPVRVTRSLGNVTVTKLSELNSMQIVGSIYGDAAHWMWSALALGATDGAPILTSAAAHP